MPHAFHTAAGTLWAEQPANARLDYGFNWTLAPGETITSSVWTVTPTTAPPLTITDQAINGAITSAFLAGGLPGSWYAVDNAILTSQGRQDSNQFMILIAGGEMLTGKSAIFPFAPAAVANVRRSRLMALAKTHFSGLTIRDDEIWNKLLAAEADAERTLRVWLSPREVVPAPSIYDAEAAALAAAGHRVHREPGYDYSPDMFRGDRWGLLELRQRPVTSVRWARLAYPLPNNPQAEIPADWFRIEGTTNRVNIVPTSTLWAAPLNAMILSVISAGRRIPFMLQVAYRAGIENIRDTLPDLPQLVERLATLMLVEDLILPQSGSVSADGLSQSLSIETAKHREIIDDKLARMRDQLYGPRILIA